MSRSLNKVILIGNLGQDPEIRTTNSGVRVAQLSLATSRRWKDRSGRPQERTEWHRIVAWEGLADVLERYARKGERLYVEGEIEYRSFEDKDGNMRYVTEIRAREVILLGGNGSGDGSGSGANRPTSTARADVPARVGPVDDYPDFAAADEDDLPF